MALSINTKMALEFGSHEGRKKLVADYGSSKVGFVGTNDSGERIILGISPTGIVETVYQNNGWIRANYYDADGYAAGETYEGRWRGVQREVDKKAPNMIRCRIAYELPWKVAKRSRKRQYEMVEEDIYLPLQTATKEEMQLAFRYPDHFYSKDHPDYMTELYWCKDQLWQKATAKIMSCAESSSKLTALRVTAMNRAYLVKNKEGIGTREGAMKVKENWISNFLLAEDVLYIKAKEPSYHVMTFGLGWNNGGTALMIDTISKENYTEYHFNALDGEYAVAEANRVAENRKDTDYVGTFTADIEVFMPELVKLPSRKEQEQKKAALKAAVEDAVTERCRQIIESGGKLNAALVQTIELECTKEVHLSVDANCPFVYNDL